MVGMEGIKVKIKRFKFKIVGNIPSKQYMAMANSKEIQHRL